MYCEIWPFNADPERIRGLAAARHHPVGRPGQPDGRQRRRARRSACSRPACRCWASATACRRMCDQLGGEVQGSDHREFGRAFVDLTDDCVLFQGVWHKGGREQVWMSHGDRVTRLPPGFRVVGVSEGAPFAAIADDARRFYGLQFHPEVVHTPHGAALLRNFTHGVLGLSGTWTMAGFRATEIARIRAQVGQGTGDLRPVGRGRFVGGRGADPRGDRRPADLHLRRSRTAAAGRGRGGGAARSATGSTSGWCIAMRRRCSSTRWTASPIRR